MAAAAPPSQNVWRDRRHLVGPHSGPPGPSGLLEGQRVPDTKLRAPPRMFSGFSNTRRRRLQGPHTRRDREGRRRSVFFSSISGSARRQRSPGPWRSPVSGPTCRRCQRHKTAGPGWIYITKGPGGSVFSGAPVLPGLCASTFLPVLSIFSRFIAARRAVSSGSTPLQCAPLWPPSGPSAAIS